MTLTQKQGIALALLWLLSLGVVAVVRWILIGPRVIEVFGPVTPNLVLLGGLLGSIIRVLGIFAVAIAGNLVWLAYGRRRGVPYGVLVLSGVTIGYAIVTILFWLLETTAAVEPLIVVSEVLLATAVLAAIHTLWTGLMRQVTSLGRSN